MEKIIIQCNCGTLSWEPPAQFEEIPGFAKDFILDNVRMMLHSVTSAALLATTDPIIAATIAAKLMIFSEELDSVVDAFPPPAPRMRRSDVVLH
jgi:hypothetical protein